MHLLSRTLAGPSSPCAPFPGCPGPLGLVGLGKDCRVDGGSLANFDWELQGKGKPRLASWNQLCFLVCAHVLICSVVSSSLGPHNPSGSSVHEVFMQEHWSELPFPPPGRLPNPGIEPASIASPILVSGFFTTSTTCFPNSLLFLLFFSLLSYCPFIYY